MLHIFFTCLFGCLSIIIGAFMAHGLEGTLSKQEIETLQLAARYLFWNAVPLFILYVSNSEWKWPRYIIQLFIVGTCCFSGSLIIYTFSKIQWLVFITPIGGISLIIAWVSLFFSCYQKHQQ